MKRIRHTHVWAFNFFVSGLIFKNSMAFFCQDFANSKMGKFVSVSWVGCEISSEMFRSDIRKMEWVCKFYLQWQFLDIITHKMSKEMGFFLYPQ